MHCYRLLVAVLLQCCAILLTSPAQASDTHIAADLVAESPAPPGETVTLAIDMQPAAGWHGYWLNPGDAGLGMVLDWSLPEGASAGEPLYPVPHKLLISGLMNHVYESEFAVLVPLTLPADAHDGDMLPVEVDAQWLACTDEICVPEQARLQTTVTVGPRTGPDKRFDRWRAQLPAPLDATAHFSIEGQTLRLGIPLPSSLALQDPHFFVSGDRIVSYAAPQAFSRKDDMLIVELQRPKSNAATPATIDGVLRLDDQGDGLSITAEPGAVPAGGDPIGSGASGLLASLPVLLLGALAGGLLLNVMPCVFPILSLKALSLARAGESEAHARVEGLAYAAGVVVACTGLGALMLGLRAAGEEVGWAFQLQEPGVVAALLLLATAITANFLGLFEFTVPGFAQEGSPQGAFATGLLAAFVATPCTGPFMAAAMGAALLLPVLPALALFAALGLGIALPFLAVAFIPALRKRLPRPGAWMVRFRHWMALPMGLTALALLWLTARLGGTSFAIVCALLTVALLVLLFLAGRAQRAGRAIGRLVVLGAVGLGLAAIVLIPRSISQPDAEAEGILPYRPFSAEVLAETRASGKPVFIWFTADWCITCKVNEQVAIDRIEVRDAFAKAGVVTLRGDWTRRDPAITRYLTERGAAGVPLYVWYPAGGGTPKQLPQVLTADTLLELAKER